LRLVVATGGAKGSGPFTYRRAVIINGGLCWSTAITRTVQINPLSPG
jgi:hypothetical protein